MGLLRNRRGSEGTQYQMREKMFAIGVQPTSEPASKRTASRAAETGMAADIRAFTDVEAPTDVRISRVVTTLVLEAY